jgi:hypothetical protein
MILADALRRRAQYRSLLPNVARSCSRIMFTNMNIQWDDFGEGLLYG